MMKHVWVAVGHFKTRVDIFLLLCCLVCVFVGCKRVLLGNVPVTWPCMECHNCGCALLNCPNTSSSILWMGAVVPGVMDTVNFCRRHSIFLSLLHFFFCYFWHCGEFTALREVIVPSCFNVLYFSWS